MRDDMAIFKDFQHNGGATFRAVAAGPVLIVEKEDAAGRFEKKVIKVENDLSIVYKLMKTKIKAAGGAAGLLAFLKERETFSDFGGCWNSQIYNWIFNSMK